MKPQIALTPDQMHELESLGLDCSDASMCWVVYTDEYSLTLEVSQSANLDYVEKYTPAYTLEDILLKLPKYLYGKDGWKLIVTKNRVAYQDVDDATDYLHDCWGNTLMQNAFEMLEWVLQNHSDKIKQL